MPENKLHIPVLTSPEEIFLDLYAESSDFLSEIPAEIAESYGESRFQIKEGCFYEYKISNSKFRLRSSSKEIVKESKVDQSSGRLSPNIYVGTLILEVFQLGTDEKYPIKVEVTSVKTKYREDYRIMLGEITERCTDLIMQHTSPVIQNFEADFERDPKTIYQQFAFLKSIIDSEEFNDSVMKIISSPITQWKEIEADNDIRSLKKLNNKTLKQIATSPNRTELPANHYLKNLMQTIPIRVRVNEKSETVDTPENRFIKYVLNSFLALCSSIRIKLSEESREKTEAINTEEVLEQYLSHSIFKEISSPDTLPLNSPVLQRKEGYREILKIWLMFNLAAKLIWNGGEDVYEAGKRDVAVLYEYWLFFKLLDLMKKVFEIDPVSIDELIEKTNDGLGLKLKQGQHIAVKGIFNGKTRKLNVEFSYNRTFRGEMKYPDSGSWTKNMRPDYTLSIWPYDIDSQDEAEKEELIVHIHFDAKYKIDKLTNIFFDDINLDEEKSDQSKGTYKRADLLKMHSYRDAIRRTGGAYILYPGDQTSNLFGYHEIIPGLGAFPMRPSKTDTGEIELEIFINDVLHHFMNRTSQREKAAFGTFEVYKEKNKSELLELLPETIGFNRGLLPDDTFVLLGYYKSQEHLDWILKNRLYNARTGSSRGTISITSKEAGAKFLLLYTKNETITSRLYKLNEKGPVVFTNEELSSIGYPDPRNKTYLVFTIEKDLDKEFSKIEWDIGRLKNFPEKSKIGVPVVYSLTELMGAIVK
jgi:predicted component of viral defense system (DUF524 family)